MFDGMLFTNLKYTSKLSCNERQCYHHNAETKRYNAMKFKLYNTFMQIMLKRLGFRFSFACGGLA